MSSQHDVIKNVPTYLHECNLLANFGPLPDGIIHPEDVTTLCEMGRRIRSGGLPDPSEAVRPDSKTGADAA